jgi:hypothetical protein
MNSSYLCNIGDVLSLLDLTLLVHDFSPLPQISIVKKGKHESRERARAQFPELALLQVPWEALGTGSALDSPQNVNLAWKKAHTLVNAKTAYASFSA